MQPQIDSVDSPATPDWTEPQHLRQTDEVPPPSMHGADLVVGTMLTFGPYFILLAIVGSFITSCAVLMYAFFAGVVDAFGDAVQHEFDTAAAKHVSVEVISLVDLFLLGTVLYVIAVGLYQLFVNPRLPTPRWLKITDLDDLKERLLATIVVLLAVSFLGYVVTWDGGFGLLAVGAGIGVVLAAIALLLRELREVPRRSMSEEEK